MIDKQDLLEELERILASPKFRGRRVIKRLLSYLAHETLNGRAEQLNQRKIALNALQRPPEFSAASSPAVRIEAGRLRHLLEEYYSGPGQDNPFIISIPKGSYQIGFKKKQQNQEGMALTNGNCASPLQTAGPRLFIHFQLTDAGSAAEENAHRLLYRLRGDMLLIFSRFRNIRLTSSTILQAHGSLTQSILHEIKAQYQVDFILNCNIRHSADGFRLYYMLAHTPNDEIVWKGEFDLCSNPAQAALDTVYLEVAAHTVATHSGIALHYWAQYLQGLAEPIPDHHQALVYYLDFIRSSSLSSYTRALEGCQQRLAYSPHDASAQLVMARLCGYEHVLQYGLITALDETWMQASRVTMKLDVGNAEAHSVFAHYCYFRGEYDLSRAELDISRNANPFDSSTLYLYGFGHCLLGEWTKGMQAIRQVLDLNFNHPDWYYVTPFVYAFNQNDYPQALAWGERIQDFGFWGDLARIVCQHRLGAHEKARTTLQALLRKRPTLLQPLAQHQNPLNHHPALMPIWQALRELAAG